MYDGGVTSIPWLIMNVDLAGGASSPKSGANPIKIFTPQDKFANTS